MSALASPVTTGRVARSRWRLARLPVVTRRRRLVAYAIALLVWAGFVALGLALAGFAVGDLASRSIRVALGSSYGLQQTLILAAPLMLTGAAVAIAARISIWNIGGDGQFYAGALAATAGNVAEAARRLQTDRPNLYRRMRRLGLAVSGE